MLSGEGCSDDIALLRCKIRRDQKVTRQAHRDVLLQGKRIRLKEEEELHDDVSLEKFKETLQQLKQKCSQQDMQRIKRAVTQGDVFINEFLKFPGSLYALIGQLTSQNPQHQLEAAGCITNLVLGHHKSTYHILKASSAYLITFLYSNNYLLQDQCAWALGNMAADCVKCSEHLKVQGIIPALIHTLKSPHQDVVLSTTFALRCYSIHQNGNYSASEKDDLATNLESLLHSKEIREETLSNVLYVLFHFTSNMSEWESFFQRIKLIPTILSLLEKYNTEEKFGLVMVTPIIRSLGNVCAGSVSLMREAISQPRFALMICKLLNSNYMYMRKEVLWLLTNIAAVMKDISILVGIEEIFKCIPVCLLSSNEVCQQALYFLLEVANGSENNCALMTTNPSLLQAIQLIPYQHHADEKVHLMTALSPFMKP